MNIHDLQAAARSGYDKSCSDLNSQPKRPGELLTLKVVSQSRVTWATSVPLLVFLGLSVLDRRQTKPSLNAPAY